MHKLICSVLIFLLCGTAKAQISIETSAAKLEVKFNKKVRLMSGVGLSGQHQQAIKSYLKNDVLLLRLNINKALDTGQFSGVFFDNIPGLKQGVTIWRYKPWNSWTEPVAITDATKMKEWDVQFFYWQYDDGTYGAAIPLSGNGFRTTLGSNGTKWGSKALSYSVNKNTEVPAMAIAFDSDPYRLFARIYKAALEDMGKAENEISKKKFPQPLEYIGWCTWNSSAMGKNLDEKHIIEGVRTFTDHKYPLGWVLIDDGWFQHKNSQLRSLVPDPKKFPNGFKPLIRKLKEDYGIKYMGVWHALGGYWNGIDPESELGYRYKGRLFSWSQKEQIAVKNSADKPYYFIKPERNDIYDFYGSWHKYLRDEGFDFIKVDNQTVTERMAVGNYPIFNLSEHLHDALYKSADKYFKGAVINCMDMSAESYFNFGTSAVARSVEDYFPYEKGEGYNMEKGNAAAHVLQGIYNAIYFSQMVYPDFDMFQSHHPNAIFHAIARTINNGPIYLTDNPGQQNFDVLNSIVLSDGRSIRSETALLPTEDCLFQVQEKKLFKAYSTVQRTGLLVLYNAADADVVSGSFKASDIHGLKGDHFAIYEHFSKDLKIADPNESFKVNLPRMGYQLHYIVPIQYGFAAFGLINKYNAPATIAHQTYTADKVKVTLKEGGVFRGYSSRPIKQLTINGRKAGFDIKNGLVTVNVPMTGGNPVVEFTFAKK
ncbi:raffinose synthase [Pedobacter sp. W3I1]|uniref:Sip1-related alpha-galactosidase n=1 Tax=Pedobacter sp. W3I1 TaxID=3042291 RepID=UPI0027801C34|nr:Sip1-related alpha-galactosidase [Pedobacter sp. W3I1]MDQ0638460.1 raffinose synthase [Pedobacter sp. W3I1]